MADNDNAIPYQSTIGGGDIRIEPLDPALSRSTGNAPRDLAGQIMNYRPSGPEHVSNLPVDNDYERMGRLNNGDALAASRVWKYEPIPNDERKG